VTDARNSQRNCVVLRNRTVVDCGPVRTAVTMPCMSDVTRLLLQIDSGDSSAADKLLPLVYDELRKLAAAKLIQEQPGQTLQATALVHEAYLRLVKADETKHWDGRRHFFAAAAEAMRRILIEASRRKGRIKRGGDFGRIPLDEVAVASEVEPEDLLALDDALTKLAAENPSAAELVRLRFFVGLDHEGAAAVLGISAVTAKRTWRYARAWLHRELGDETSTPTGD
jgi:RNA polymerase sigma factor (TIGR02999 family)